MIRIVIENMLLFILPTAVYLAYCFLVRSPDGPAKPVLEDAPMLWLSASGAALVVLTLVVFGSTSGGAPSQGYQPPGMRDGKVVPGHQQ